MRKVQMKLGKWLSELFLRADDKKLIETGDWLMDEHITAHSELIWN